MMGGVPEKNKVIPDWGKVQRNRKESSALVKLENKFRCVKGN